jgi:protein OS-9
MTTSWRTPRYGSPAPSTAPSTHQVLQFEVLYSDSPVTEQEAQALLQRSTTHDVYSPESSSHADLLGRIRGAAEGETADDTAEIKLSETYEIMNLPPLKYICSIPILKPPAPENQTANELAKAEEARELSRATESGWELLEDLGGGCLYFMSGWWSYSFCYNREVVQFHALPTVPNGGPPVRDPHTAEYVLGRVPSSPSGQRQPPQHQKQPLADNKPPNAELQVKGDQRYLVQRLDGGTTCDLTGRERTIEVQYHCVPGIKGDRIGWIKEVTTCAYLMIINTPRLCAEPAFLPPKESSANPITCSLVVSAEDLARTKAHRSGETIGANEAAARADAGKQVEVPTVDASKDKQTDQGTRKSDHAGVSIGGVVVGGQNLLSKDEHGNPPPKLTPPRTYIHPRDGGGPLVETIASAKSKAEGGKMEVLTRDQLEKLDLNPDLVEEMKQELQKLAGDKGWKLEVVELPGDPREIRGIVDVDPGEEDDKDDKAEGSEEKFFKEEL